MAKKLDSNTNPRDINLDDVRQLDRSFYQGLTALPNQANTPSNKQDIDSVDNSVSDIVRSELKTTKSITGDDMSMFLVKLFNEQDYNRTAEYNTLEDIFQGTDESLIQFFQDRYQNRNLMYEDLNMITTQLFEMEEAVKTTVDAIITSDDISQTISSTLKFENAVGGDERADAYISSIKKMERELNIPAKIKSTIIPNTLRFGTYYVYTIPYAKLFEQQYKHKLDDPAKFGHSLHESCCTEAFVNEVVADVEKIRTGHGDKDKYTTGKLVEESLGKYVDGISVCNDICSIPLLEGVDITGMFDDTKFKKKVEKASIDDGMKNTYSDGVQSTDVEGKFDFVNDVYIRYIDPRKMIPVKILNTTLGYYYVHDSEIRINKAPFATSIRVTTTGMSPNTQYSDEVERMFMSKITDKIVNAFDYKFLQKNQKFKDLVMDALMYNDMYKNNIKFQFIPAEYITEFKVNEDENGEGVSILSRSLFYARLYLSLLIFQMISIVTRSNDTRIWYVKNSGIDANISNKVQEAARAIKSKQINFMDLLNYNSIISKIGQYKEIFMPLGRSGDRALEFDTLQGQDVQMNNEFMENLRNNMISATGVPSVIMNYIHELDFAKTLQMANAKFVGRVVSLQLDLNPQITEFYKKLIKFSGVQVVDDYVDRFMYVLNPPKTLNNNNVADMFGSADNLASAIVKAVAGESDNSDETAAIKDVLYQKLIREYMPMLDWDAIFKYLEESKIEAKQIINVDRADASGGSSY